MAVTPVDIDNLRFLLAEGHQSRDLLLALVSGRPRVNVTVVNRGAEFLRILQEQPFDCLILDEHLPDYRADQLLDLAPNRWGEAPALVISGGNEQAAASPSLKSNHVHYVPKSAAIRHEHLWSHVEQAMLRRLEVQHDRPKTGRRHRHLALFAETDPLTGLYKREYLDRCLQENRWRSDRRQWLACLMVDIDHFRQMNDRFGRAGGDAVLAAVAAEIRKHASGSVVIRWSGKKILIIKAAGMLLDEWLWAEALRQRVEVMQADVPLRPTVSIGLARCRSRHFSLDTIHQAHESLDLAKDRGRNLVCVENMVHVSRAINSIAQDCAMDVVARRRELLDRLRDQLGPTQWQHISDHCEQVSALAVRIAGALELSPAESERVRIAAFLHDIGKCVIPEELLAKPRSLSAQEWRLMARHEIYGEWITRAMGVDEQTTRYIREHHERYDNSRSPRSNPDGSGILCVADALVTMRTTRAYRTAMSLSTALQELQRERGGQFDPAVVDAAHNVYASTQRLAA